jgi:hypothetical protein
MECWNIGMVEYWGKNCDEFGSERSEASASHHSIIPGTSAHTKKGEGSLRPFGKTSQRSSFLTHVLEIGIDHIFL